MPKSKVMELAIKIGGKVDKSLGTSTKAASKQLASIQKTANKVSSVVAVGLTAMGTGAIAATKYLTDLGGEWKTATNQVAAATGAAGAELDTLRGAMEDVYSDNFGDSIQDVADAVALVDRNMANLGADGMVQAAEGALALRDAFEYDVAESTRAAEAIRKNFGTSVEDSFSLIAAGAQNGLDYSGELIDTINEYSSQFAKLGFDADGMFNILQAGADGTAWNLDKVGDAIKEFSIRAIDGSTTTVDAFTAMGYNADDMMAKFAAGGEGANDAFFDVLDTLMEVDDQVQRDALGVALFGTQWEDLGVEAMQAMADASTAAYDTGEALEQLANVKYDDLGSVLQGLGRQMEVAILPAADEIYQSLMEHMPEMSAAMEELSPVIAEIAGDFADWAGGAISEGLPVLVDGIKDLADWAGKAYDKVQPFLSFLWEHKGTAAALAVGLRLLGPAVSAVSTAVNAFKTAKTFMSLLQSSGKVAKLTSAFKTFGTVLTGPIGIIIAVAGALALLYKNWDTVKAWLESFGAKVNQIWTAFSTAVSNAISAIGEKFPALGAFLQGFWQSIQSAVDHVKGIFQGILDFISNVFAGNWSAAWDSIVSIFGNLFGGLVDLAKAPINAVVSALNWLIGKINSISIDLPDWGILGQYAGMTVGFNIPEIPQLAEGGIATSPTLAEIGEGTEPEAVLPLSKLAELLDEFTKPPKPEPNGSTPPAQGGGDGETIVYSPVLNFYGSADRGEVEQASRQSFAEFKKMYRQLKAEEARKNFKA